MNSELHKLFKKKLIEKNMKLTEASKFLGCSPQFVFAVFSGKSCLPRKMLPKMAALLDLDEAHLGLAFGYYPQDWLDLCQASPDIVYKAMTSLLSSIKTNPDLKPVQRKGKPQQAL